MSGNQEAHSVLFESSELYNQQPHTGGGGGQHDPYNPQSVPSAGQYNSDNLQFYSSNYPGSDHTTSQHSGAGNYPHDHGGGEAPYQYQPPPSFWSAFGTCALPGEPPLLEELGINFGHIKTKTVTVLNPLKQIEANIMDDVDLAGPILFCLLLGLQLFFMGKSQFGYIYGVAVFGCLSIYLILNLMSENGIDGYRTSSVLGYCLLPLVIMATVGNFASLEGPIGMVMSLIVISWSTYSSSLIFATILQMNEQRLLIAYPIALLYTRFLILTLF